MTQTKGNRMEQRKERMATLRDGAKIINEDQ